MTDQLDTAALRSQYIQGVHHADSRNHCVLCCQRMPCDWQQAFDDIHALCDEIDRLRSGYAEAISDIKDWAGYADDYFKEKWDLAGDLARHRAILEDNSDGTGNTLDSVSKEDNHV